MQNNTVKKCDDRVILIYHNFKGAGQNIRILLSYLDLAFSDIYLDEYDTQKQTLPLEVRKILEEHPVNRSKLPAIIHEGQIIYELNQIMTYICRAFDREDLLGSTIEQKSHVCEFMEIYSHRLATNTRFLMAFLEEVLSPQLEGLCLLSFAEAKFDQLLETSGYIAELTQHFLKHGGHSFILGHLTILDFYFLQAARQTLAIFACIDQKTANQNWTEIAGKYLKLKKSMGEEIRNAHILRGLKQFHDFFISQQFYSKKEDYFEKFNIVPKRANESTIKGMEKVWAIEQKYFKC